MLILEMRQMSFEGSKWPKVAQMGAIGPPKLLPVSQSCKVEVLSTDQSGSVKRRDLQVLPVIRRLSTALPLSPSEPASPHLPSVE